jgi:hypothetical protein
MIHIYIVRAWWQFWLKAQEHLCVSLQLSLVRGSLDRWECYAAQFMGVGLVCALSFIMATPSVAVSRITPVVPSAASLLSAIVHIYIVIFLGIGVVLRLARNRGRLG